MPKSENLPTCYHYPLQFRKIWKKLIALEIGRGDSQHKNVWSPVVRTLFLLTLFLVVMGVLSDQLGVAVNWASLVSLVLLIWFVLYTGFAVYLWLYLFTYYYDLDDHYLRVRKGVIVRREISIPYDRIHDVYLDQDPLDNVFRLYDLYVATASQTSVSETHIDGLSYRDGQLLRDMLLEKVRLAGNEE